MPLHVGTWNCRVTVPIDKVRHDLARILPEIEVLGLQEWGGSARKRLLESLAPHYGYSKPGSRTGSVVWERKRFEFEESEAVTAAKGRNVGRIPGLRMILKDYEVAVVTLRDLTTGDAGRDQERVTVINCHAPVWRPGARGRMHAEYVATVAKLHAHYEGKGHDVYTLGDWNRTPRWIRGRFAEHANALSLWAGRKVQRTHGRRSIDDIYSRCRARSVRTIRTASDHRAVVATF